MPISKLLLGKRNSFGFLRWLFAALVIVDHTFPLGGFDGGQDPLWKFSRNQDSFGGLAVAGFFIISGFLITRSWNNSRSAIRYLWHRVLRIFPGYWACLLLTAFVFAPIAWHYEFGGVTGFFASSSAGPLDYLRNNFWLQEQQYGIRGLLLQTPFGRVSGGAWNGSTWTLIYEFRCYLLIAALGLAGLLARHRAVVLVITGGLYLAMVSYLIDPTWAAHLLPQFSDPYVARFTCLFFLGCLAALFADQILIDDRLGIASAVVALWTLHSGGWLVVGYPAFAYCIIWLALRLPFTRFDRPGDFSYGTYIYAFPIQMMLAERNFQQHGVIAFVAASLLLSTAAAFLSWHLVEKRALKLKNWTPFRSRGRRQFFGRRPAAGGQSPTGLGTSTQIFPADQGEPAPGLEPGHHPVGRRLDQARQDQLIPDSRQ